MRVEELIDGRWVGTISSEVMSFPIMEENRMDIQLAQIRTSFEQILTEFRRLGYGIDAAAELCWITQPVVQQAFHSCVRAFITIRVLAHDRSDAENWAKQFSNSIRVTLETLRFRVQPDSDSAFSELIAQTHGECTLALSKERRLTGATTISLPYAYCKQMICMPTDNYETFVQSLSQCKACMVSIQVFSTLLDAEERAYYGGAPNELAAVISEAQRGTVWLDASIMEAHQALIGIQQAVDNLLLFSIVIRGGRSDCIAIEAKLAGMLTGSESCNLLCYDLSEESFDFVDSLPLYPWNILNKLIYDYQLRGIDNSTLSSVCLRMPNIVFPQEMTTFFRLPLRTDYMPALRESDKETGVEQFDSSLLDHSNIQIGVLLNRPDISIGIPNGLLTKHMLIVGMPGSGKTTFCINMLLQLARKGIPFLAIEPTKSEYRAMIDAIPDLRVFTPGNNKVSPFIINPFVPPKGINVEKYIPSLFSAFHSAFSMPSPLDILFLKAIRQCYMRYGWKDDSCAEDKDVTPFGLYEFVLEFKQIVDSANYAKDVKGNLQSAGTFRLMNLIEQNSNIYDTINTIPLEDLLKAPTVLELNAIDDAEQKALLMSLMLISICAYTKHNMAGDGKLKNVLLLDEAHVLLAPGEQSSDAQGAAVTRLQNMIVEIRSYGTSIIIADQSPSRVTREVVANTDIKIAFRLVQGIDRELIADSCNMTDRASLELSKLRPGQAYTYCSLLQTPQLIQTPDKRKEDKIKHSVPDTEIIERMDYWDSHQQLLRPFLQCRNCSECKQDCDMQIRSTADYLAGKMVMQYSALIPNAEKLMQYLQSMRKILSRYLSDYTEEQQQRLMHCTMIRFYRKLRLTSGITISDKTLLSLLSKRA